MRKGFFITFEGPDGSGKTTQIKLLSDYLTSQGYTVILTREPGGTETGERIRQIILDPERNEYCNETELLLYAASRAQLVYEVIKPNLEAGNIVISDRYVDSSVAYQGFGRGLKDYVEMVNDQFTKDCMPDMTLLFKIDDEAAKTRAKGKPEKNKKQDKDFYKNALAGYEYVEKKYPDRIFPIDASQAIDEIAYKIIKITNEKCTRRKKG